MKLHDTDSESCWCGPTLEQPCPELEARRNDLGAVSRCPASCWRCGGRSFVEPYDDGVPTVIIHWDVEG